jgi:vacuolar iron transporter family protein
MDHRLSSHVHAAAATAVNGKATGRDAPAAAVDIETAVADPSGGEDGIDYMVRAQWLRAAVLGANDGLISVASLMIGVGAVATTRKAMLVSGMAGLVAGACSMVIGEFVSVYAHYDIELSQIRRGGNEASTDDAKESLPSPTKAALASALSFAVGALLPLLSGVSVPSWDVGVAAVCAASSVGLAGFGAAGAYLGGSSMLRSGFRVVLGGWFAMLVTFAVLRLFGKVFQVHVSSA